MRRQDTDNDWFRELLSAIGPISVRRMFGGTGYYAEGVMIALEAYDELYLKVDAETKARFAAAGGRPFVYDGKGKQMAMSYWTVPDEAMDAAEAMRPWAALALAAALRKPVPKAAKRTKAAQAKISTGRAKPTVSSEHGAKLQLENNAVKRSAEKKAATKQTASSQTSKKQTSKKQTSKKPSVAKRASKTLGASRSRVR
jgi:DNA transformation protein and related proteins